MTTAALWIDGNTTLGHFQLVMLVAWLICIGIGIGAGWKDPEGSEVRTGPVGAAVYGGFLGLLVGGIPAFALALLVGGIEALFREVT